MVHANPLLTPKRRCRRPSASSKTSGRSCGPPSLSRPLPRRLRRDPWLRNRCHCHWGDPACTRLVRCPRCHRRAGPVRQRRLLPLETLEADLRRNRDVKARFTRSYRPRGTARSNVSTGPWLRRMGFRLALQPEHARRTALSGWLHTYDHHRQHSAIGRNVSFSRLTNVPRQHTERDACAGLGAPLTEGGLL